MYQPVRILRRKEVMRRTGLSGTTLWRMSNNGLFPQSIILNPNGNAVGWLEEEVDAWILSRERGKGRMKNDL